MHKLLYILAKTIGNIMGYLAKTMGYIGQTLLDILLDSWVKLCTILSKNHGIF